MPRPDEPGISDRDRKARAKAIREVADLPETGIPNLGDISQITDEDLEALGPVYVLEGGSPCHGFSVAGLRKGLADSRGQLTLEFCRLAQRMRRINNLQYVVWENVRGALSDETNGFGNLLAALAGEEVELVAPRGRWTDAGHIAGPDAQIAWRVLNAKFWGVAQSRERIFAVASFTDLDPGIVLFEQAGSGWNPEENQNTREEAARGCRDGARIGEVIALGMDSKDSISRGQMHGLKASNGHNPPAVVYSLYDGYTPKASTDTAYTLLAGWPTGGGHKQMVVHRDDEDCGWVVRRITPTEAERLQGFPDGWTAVDFRGKPMSDSPRYKALGNSMAVPCMHFIGSRLAQYHSEQSMNEVAAHRETA
ncbi:DNA cytosine methyltransferase [Aliihoeflea sp. 2WW]|uniref:DNA cytosine methyltransferase n=1 Tax=Aliihoeflea sp. 2WW TaxID=1381123 RepID=UPI0004637572|nr:DNA cytosine methyltransferase [Aliihoeflea sp. 2WW]